VAVAALGLDAVVPRVRNAVAVDVGVCVREADVGKIVFAADRVVEVVPLFAVDLVVADDVVAAAVAVRDRLRAGGMVPRPAVRAEPRVVNAVALDDRALEPPGRVAHRAHARVHVHADLPAFAVRVTVAAPAADVVVLDHHVVRAGKQANRILLRTFQREAADDDVGRRDRDVVLLGVAAIDGRAVTFVEHIAARRAALGPLERASGGGLHRTRDWKALAPGAGADLLPAERDLVRGAGLALDDAAAALAGSATGALALEGEH